MGGEVKPLDFNRDVPRQRHRLSRRAWYVVFGAGRVHQTDKLLPKDLAERIHTLYNDIDPGDVEGIIENYLEQRRQTNVES
ncbi:hypothetical protein [Staphylococcus haemolyticus]|jgi:hypothetical protein|uniref:Uncharacterized protein n=1 Tax=Cronobacter phage vB_CsaM_GAP31 TaxID=1141135 RepID=K4F5N7_9CAUD|nr:hypothetical protein [Staphylococcus haemolyticus]YP_006986858.1 hypothetical protein GAP31_025 [Cronobacter phage vB_CsaM_GAP31]AFC21203.1 hypothetical protein GAP31_025 [Cronobacter phage vB_CsaM_GAP31]MCC3723260.1 hypothetical protein [Staphylococcus haemolyticus]